MSDPPDALMPVPEAAVPENLKAEFDAARSFARMSKSKSTRRVYRSSWRNFEQWCAQRGLDSHPATPVTVAMFLSHLATSGKSPSTIGVARAAIASAHTMVVYDDPTTSSVVQEVLSGIKNSQGVAPRRQAAPLLLSDLQRIVGVMDDSLHAIRDRALLTTGWAIGARRSELVAFTLGDLDMREQGAVLYLRKSKTDQAGRGRFIGLPYYQHHPTVCPSRALAAWLHVLPDQGAGAPLFPGILGRDQLQEMALSPQAVSRILRKWLERAGIPSEGYSAHALRAGIVSEASARQQDALSISAQTGHASLDSVKRYSRRFDVFHSNLLSKMGL